MGTAVTVLSILGPTLITKAANRVVKLFEVLQKWEQTLNKQISKEPNALAPIFHFAWFPFTRQDELGTIILALLSLCFFGNFGSKWDREGTRDTRREEVERRAQIIILTRHDIPLPDGTMISHCCHNDEPEAQWTMFAQSRESKHNFPSFALSGLDGVASPDVFLQNIAELQNYAQHCSVA